VIDDPCQSAYDRVYQIDANCSTSTVTQTVLYVLNDSTPKITALAPFADFGCAGDTRTLAMSSNAVVAVDAISTNLVMETRITNGCQVTVTRTWRVEDCCGNFDLKNEVYTFTDAPAPPVFAACPSDPLVIGCITSSNQVPATILDATSTCDVTVSQMDGPHTPVANTCGAWTFDRTFTATDVCGATATCIQTIIYTLDIPPVAPTPEAPFTATCVAAGTVPAGLPAPLPGVMVSAQVVTNGCDVTMTRTYTTNNCCGISAQASVAHSWTTVPAAPTLTGPSFVELGCILDIGNIPVPSTSQLTASSDCQITSLVLSASSAIGVSTNCCEASSFTRTYTAVDSCGQSVDFEQTITFTLSEVPEILAVEKGTNLGCQVAGTIPPTNDAAVVLSGCALASVPPTTTPPVTNNNVALIDFQHTAGSANPDATAAGIVSTAALAGTLNGAIVTTVNSFSGNQNNNNLATGNAANPSPSGAQWISYSVANTNTNVTFKDVTLTVFRGLNGPNLYDVTYLDSTGTEVAITSNVAIANSPGTTGTFAFGPTADVVEFRVYVHGRTSNNSSAVAWSRPGPPPAAVAVQTA